MIITMETLCLRSDMIKIHGKDLVAQGYRFDPLTLAMSSNNYLFTQQSQLIRKLCMDTYNPAISTDVLNSRFCDNCNKYFSSVTWKNDHKKACHPRGRGRGG